MLRSLRTLVPLAALVLLGAPKAGAVVTGSFPTRVAVNPTTGRVYVANNGGHSVTVIDGASSTVVATVPVGHPVFSNPTDIAVNPVSNRVYVATLGDNLLSVIDGVSNAVIASVQLDGILGGVAVDATTGRIYVSMMDLHRVDILEATNLTVVSSIDTRDLPHKLALNPHKHRLYVTSTRSDLLIVVNTAADVVVTKIRVRDGPEGVAINRTTNRIYVANSLDGSISVIDGFTNTVVDTIRDPLLGGCCPSQVAVNERTNKLYVDGGSSLDGQLLEIDGQTHQVTRRFLVADASVANTGIGIDERLGRIYASLGSLNNVAVVLDKELLVNASFEQRSESSGRCPFGWRTGNLETLLDLRSLDAYDGNRSFRFTGAGGVTKALVQEIAVSGAAGAVIHFEAFSKAAGASETGGAYTVVFRVYYDDGTQRTVHLPFTRGTHDWERQAARLVASKPFSRFTYRIVYADQTGEAWFDALHVSMESPAS